ncbi:MAG: hypothetical protein GF364_11645 [Candidatus Lokiarchaeota archaeon]|nr:hypothetical protein [Candidatus Lokiarchaeota archaeon]
MDSRRQGSSLFRLNPRKIKNSLMNKLKNRIIDIDMDEKICAISYSYTKFEFIMAVFCIIMFPPLLTTLVSVFINVDLVNGEFLLPICIIEIIILPILFWNLFYRLIKFNIGIFTDKAIYGMKFDKSADSPLLWRYAYKELRYVTFTKKDSVKKKQKIPELNLNEILTPSEFKMPIAKGSFVYNTKETTYTDAYENIVHFETMRRILLSLVYRENPPSERYRSYIVETAQMSETYPADISRIPKSFPISEEALHRIERKKEKFRKYGTLLFSLIIVIIIILNLFPIYMIFLIDIYAVILIPLFIGMTFSEYKELENFDNSDSNSVEICDNHIEYTDNRTGDRQKYHFTTHLSYYLRGTIRQGSNAMEQDIDTISLNYLNLYVKPIVISKIERVNEFYFLLEHTYMQWLKSKDYFLTPKEAGDEFLKLEPFNQDLLRLIERNIERSNEQKNEHIKQYSSIHDGKEDSSAISKDFRGEKQYEKYPVEKIHHFFEENEEVEYRFHPQPLKSSLLKPWLIIIGVLLGIGFYFLIDKSLNSDNESWLYIYGIIGWLFELMFLFFYVLLLLSEISTYFKYKNMELVFTNKKLYVFAKNSLNIVMYPNIMEVSCLKKSKVTKEYKEVNLRMNYALLNLKSSNKFKIELGVIQIDDLVFSVLNSKGITINRG